MEDACLLTSLPDVIIAALWPAKMIGHCMCVCHRGLTRALLTAPRVDLRHIIIEPSGATALAGTLRLMNLRGLDLGSSFIRDAGMVALVGALEPMTVLQTLVLSRNGLNGLGYWQSLQHLTALQTLCLRGNNLGDEGVKAVGPSLQLLTALQNLNLSSDNIGPEGWKDLGALLPHLTALRTLDLQDNVDVEGEGFEAFVSSLQHLTFLQSLNLDDNNPGTVGARLWGCRCST